jgi:AraC family transcriptional regulator
MLQRFGGAALRRVIDASGADVPEHAHDWPLLSLFVIGSYANRTEIGEELICGPSAVLYAAGAAHRNTAGPDGFEQIEIEFDPDWLGAATPTESVLRWVGGRRAAEAQALARICSQAPAEDVLRRALRRFLRAGPLECRKSPPAWLEVVSRQLRADPARKVSELARQAGLHASWLGTAYRQATGEGLMDAAARFRVEHAARELRETDLPLADIATNAGFYDQSHMIRTFRRILGRLPSEVRNDKCHIRQATERA